MSRSHAGVALGLVLALARPAPAARQTLGLFSGSGDVGIPSTIGAGSAVYDAARKTYTVSGGGENMWAAADHFQYVWKKVSGDVMLEATIEFTGTRPATGAPNAHRKACLVIRQSLDSDAVYADAAVHGDGLTSLQWRDAKGAVTHEVQSAISGPTRLRIEKRGSYVSMSLASAGEALRPAGGAARVEFTGEFYVGLGVSAHDTVAARAGGLFGRRARHAASGTGRTTLVNTLETISLRPTIGASPTSSPSRAASKRRTGSPTTPTRCISTPAASCTRCRPTRPARRRTPTAEDPEAWTSGS